LPATRLFWRAGSQQFVALPQTAKLARRASHLPENAG
jgi:hypothetical protein